MILKNVASQKAIFFAFDATTNVPKTGDAANITPYVSKDYGAVTAVTDTSATEMDATNAPGYYLVDLTQGETNAEVLLLSAKSSTANVKVIGAPAVIFTMPTTGVLSPATLGRTAVVDANGLIDANMVKAGPTGSGTAQTARDLGGQLDAAVTTRAAASALATAQADLDTLTGTDGATLATAQALYAPAKAGDAMALTSGERTTLAAAIWNALTSGMSTVGSIGKKLADWAIHSAADVWAAATRTLTAATNITSTGGTTVPQTGDSFARLGAPAGASVSADVAAVKTDTGNLVTRITSALFAGITSLAEWLGLIAGKQSGNATARTELRATGAGSGSFDETTDSQEAIRDNQQTAAAAALTSYDPPTNAEMEARTLAAASYATASGVSAVETDTQDIQARLPAALTAGGYMKSDALAINGATAAAVRLALSSGVIIPGTVDSTAFTPTTTVFEADDITTAAADHYIGRVVIFTSGTLIGQATTITDYALTSGRGRFTVDTLTSAPANDVTFVIV